MPAVDPRPTDQPNHILTAITEGDVERLSNFFFTSAAKSAGNVFIAPEGVGWDDIRLRPDALQPIEHDPARDIDEALRWCVVVGDIPECDAETKCLMHID